MAPLNLEVDTDSENFFAGATHLMEVSGVLNNGMQGLEKRMKDKLRRLEKALPDLPTFIIVVEFSIPYSRMSWL